MTVALCTTALLLIVAIVIDLGATRSDRRGGQSAVDTAVAAAGQSLQPPNGQAACATAIDYIELALETPLAFPSSDCTSFAACVTGTTVLATGGEYQVTVHYPVPDGSPLLARTSTIGAAPRTDTPGIACHRFGVEVTTTGDSFFGGIAGETERRSSVHAVVLVTPPTSGGRLLNLAVLERRDCVLPSSDAEDPDGGRGLRAEGQGQIVVAKIVEGAIEYPGTVTVDSDGTGLGCTSDGVTMLAAGGSAIIRADGIGSCIETDDGPSGAGCGAGIIEVFASGAPGCNAPACSKTNTATIAPLPVPAPTQLTRAAVDHIFNCKVSYATERWGTGATFADATTGTTFNTQPISGCGGSPTAHIDVLETAAGTGTPAGFQRYSASHPCGDVNDPVTLTTGQNWWVDCDVTIRNTFELQGGNIVFEGDVILTGSSASLRLNDSTPGAYHAYLRGAGAGVLRKDAQATMTVRSTMVYVGEQVAEVSFAGGTGALTLTAPTSGRFKDLALWSETAVDHGFSGQATFDIEGTFFSPLARIDYAGTTDKDIAAQFVARTLTARGQGRLTLQPTRGVRVDADRFDTRLIR